MKRLNCLRSLTPLIAVAVFTLCAHAGTPRWQRFEAKFQSSIDYTNGLQQAELTATFTGPGGKVRVVPAFWDGGKEWKVRFAPDEVGKWTYRTACTDSKNEGLDKQQGEIDCTAATGTNMFDQHGPVIVAPDGRYLQHQDGTPFFFLADTVWNGPLLSTDEEWDDYLKIRRGQNFNAAQWVTTQWRAAPEGDQHNNKAYSGNKQIVINPDFFKRLDKKVETMNKAGMLSVPVLLWAIGGGANPAVNPGHSLPEDQAILLARHMVARWGGNNVLWMLGGDGDYRGDKAARWQRIGRAVFDSIHHAPATMHPGGMHWIWKEFKDEKWMDIVGYQSGHGDDDKTLRWLVEGPIGEDWTKFPHRPFINLEPPYENHIAYQSKTPISADTVRRAVYWSLLNAPTAGVSYGGHGVWGWDDGTKPPTDHPTTGTPLPWKKALEMPGAQQMKFVHDFFSSNSFWRLRPTPMVVVDQPGRTNSSRFVAAARTDLKDVLVVYTPEDRTLTIKLDALPPSPSVTWINPRNGERSPAVAVVTANTVQFPTPSEGDWILFMETQKEKPPGESKPAKAAE